jgi:hypothetical protein
MLTASLMYFFYLFTWIGWLRLPGEVARESAMMSPTIPI